VEARGDGAHPARRGGDHPPDRRAEAGGAGGIAAALGTVAAAVAGGDLSPEEGQAVAAVLETQRRAIETAELEARIAALETRTTKGNTR